LNVSRRKEEEEEEKTPQASLVDHQSTTVGNMAK
jgi:hypothetical protein